MSSKTALAIPIQHPEEGGTPSYTPPPPSPVDWKMSNETYETIIAIIDTIAEVGESVAAAALSEVPVIGPILGWALVNGGAWILKKLVGLIPRVGDSSATSFEKQEQFYKAVLEEEARLQKNRAKAKMNAALIPNRASELVPEVVLAKDISGNLQMPKLKVRNDSWRYNRPELPIMIYPKDDLEKAKLRSWISRGFPMANPVGFVHDSRTMTPSPLHVW